MWNNSHQQLGTVLFALVPLQFGLGYLHHRQMMACRTWLWLIHSWYGKILMILGVVNAGLGLTLAANWIMSGYIAFLFTVVIFLGVYIVSNIIITIHELRLQKSWKAIAFPGKPRQRHAQAPEESIAGGQQSVELVDNKATV
jgi:hypothetical protein